MFGLAKAQPDKKHPKCFSRPWRSSRWRSLRSKDPRNTFHEQDENGHLHGAGGILELN
jgi:hypothetical protein